MFRNPVCVAVFCIATLISTVCLAQDYPSKAITFITPASPGSTADVMTRVMAERLASDLGKPVVVMNRTGGSGLIAARALLAAPPDGYTIYLSTLGTLAMNPHVLKEMPFDPAKALIPVAMAGSMPMVVAVNPKQTPVRSLKELFALSKKEPLTYGSPGAGSTPAIAAALLANRAGVQMTHVAYQGFSPAILDVLAGRLTMVVPDIGTVRSYLSDGSLRALAVSTTQRSKLAPDVPTMKEMGYDVDVSLWYGVFVRAGTPLPIVDRLERAMRATMGSAAVQKRWQELGLENQLLIGADFAKFYQSELKRWGVLIPPLGIKLE